MRRGNVFTFLVLFLGLSCALAWWTWRRFDESQTALKVSDDFAMTDRLASTLVAQWNKNPATNLKSPQLPATVKALRHADCIRLPSAALPLDLRSLPDVAQQDLEAALAQFLQAYAAADPEAVLDFHRQRRQIVNPQLRPVMERTLSKRGVPEPSRLSDEDLFRSLWTSTKTSPHWSGLVTAASGLQVWNGRDLPFDRLQAFEVNSVVETPPEELDQASYLFRLFRGNSSPRNHFVSVSGSLTDALAEGKDVLLCDAQFIIQFDDSLAHKRAAYLIRFWWNDRLEKWQPLTLNGFAIQPHAISLPSILF